MKIIALLTSLVFLSVSSFTAAQEKPVLHVYTWEGYFAPETVRKFEEKTGAKVEFETYDSNETMIEKLRQAGGYDVITPPGFAIGIFSGIGAILELDHSLLPNIRNISPNTTGLTHDSKMKYSIPYTVTLTGVGYNPEMVPEDAIGSWEIFGDSRLAGKLAMMNDMRETIGAALKYKGYSLNSTDPNELKEAGEQLLKWKKNIRNFSIDEARYGLRDGRYAAIQAYVGDVQQAAQENPKLKLFIPNEGTAFNSDKFAICSDSENPELAHAFINHYLDAEIAAENMKFIEYYMPNKSALKILGDIISDHPALTIEPEVKERSEVVKFLGAENISLYEDTWEKVLMGAGN